MYMTKDKLFYKSIIDISIPIAIQNLITVSVNMADTVMLGRLGEVELSAAAIANHLFFILMVLMFGISGGSNVMCSQYYGKKDIKSIHKIVTITYWLSIALSILFVLVAMVMPGAFMKLFTDDVAVISMGEKYIRIVSISYVFYSLTVSTVGVLRSVKTVKIPMIIHSISLFINIFLNYILIFGRFGISPLGIKGAAIATVISRIIEFFIIFIYIIFKESKVKYRLNYVLKIDKLIFNDYIKVTSPIFFNELCWSVGSSMISIIVGRMGTSVVAANSINNVVNQFATLFIQGLSSASSVIIGNTIGRGNYNKVKEYANTISVLSIIVGIISALIIYFCKDVILGFYNISQETKLISKEIMTATAIVALFRSLSSNLMMGVLRGGGDNKYVFKYEMIFMWGLSIPLGFISAFVFNLPIPIVFFLLKSDEILKGIVGFIRVKSGNWINDVTRDKKDT